MDRLDAMRVFLAVVDAGSFAEAARRLGCSPASVSRAVVQLEIASDERLLERSTRQLTVTEAGQRHAASYRLILDELASIDGRAERGGIGGTVVVTAPELFGRIHIQPLVDSFLALHPGVQVRFLLLNRVVDLIGEGVNVAIRIAHLPDSSLTAIRLGEVRKIFCAAPAYLEAHGRPAHPVELTNHACIGLNELGQHELWQYRETASARPTRAVRVDCRLSLNSAGASIDAAKRGSGIIHPISYQVKRYIDDGSLAVILADYEQEPMPVHLIFASRPALSSAARALVDHLVPALRDSLRC